MMTVGIESLFSHLVSILYGGREWRELFLTLVQKEALLDRLQCSHKEPTFSMRTICGSLCWRILLVVCMAISAGLLPLGRWGWVLHVGRTSLLETQSTSHG